MILHLLILSGEDEDFVRELLIDGSNTFEDLHNAIQDSAKYDRGQLASFFAADEDWNKSDEITLMQMDDAEDVKLMNQVKIEEYLDSAKDRMIYTFDFFSNRGFFIEVIDVAPEATLAAAKVVRTEGIAPIQIEIDDPFEFETEEIFDYEGEEDDMMDGYNEDEFDGFGEYEEDQW